ncbi:MAG: DUF1592 domain-containing protein [Myxococcota bacterium]
MKRTPPWADFRTALCCILSACSGAIGDPEGVNRDRSLDPSSGTDVPPFFDPSRNPSDPNPDPGVPSAAPPTVQEDDCEGVSQEPVPTVVSRLTRDEYIQSIEDLFGIDVGNVASDLPFEIRAPFTTTSVAQTVDIKHVEVYAEVSAFVSERLGNAIVDDIDCRTFDESCEVAFVNSWGSRVFRRPLEANEVTAFRPIFDVVEQAGDDFVTAAGLVLRAMIQSPQFLYHLEQPVESGTRDADGYEMASRISYLVWQSGPDDLLLQAAANGQLSESTDIEEHVRRLARDERARRASLSFFEDWVDLSRLERAVRDVSDSDKSDMREETERLVEDVLWNQGGGLVDLVSAEKTFLNPDLANRYDLEASAVGWMSYDLTSVPERRGILTHGSLLAAHANGNRPAFVSRGLFILRSFLCRDVPDPPAGVDTNVTDLAETAGEREQSAERLARGSCGPCHQAFDPLAYAFEGFDGFGRRIETDTHGNPVRSDGWVPAGVGAASGSSAAVDQPYEDLDGLVEILVDAPFVERCLAEKPFGFALRRELELNLEDRCAVRSVAEDARQRGGAYEDLLVAIATHPMFRRVAGTE